MDRIQTRRLSAGDRELAGTLFAMMSEVFDEERVPLAGAYLDSLLGREDFLAIAAFSGADIVGGITAHILPMTRMDSAEIFIYDIAIRKSHQRQGVGRCLVKALRECAAAAGIHDIFVAADSEDLHALDFYRALGGTASPVTFFTFSDHER